MARSGIASPLDYLLGRGELYFTTDLDAAGRPKGFKSLGNAEAFTVTVESEVLEHFSSLSGLKVKDRETVLSQAMNLSFQLAEIDSANLAKFVSGSAVVVTQTGATITPTSGQDNLKNVMQGEWFDLYDIAAPTEYPPIGAARTYRISAVTVKDTTDVTTYVLDTDYKVDLELGRIFIIVGGAITDLDELLVSFTFATLNAKTEIRGLTTSKLEGALKFISRNANKATESEWEYNFHQVSLTADGDFGLISDEFATLNLKGSAEKNEVVGGSGSPYVTVIELGA